MSVIEVVSLTDEEAIRRLEAMGSPVYRSITGEFEDGYEQAVLDVRALLGLVPTCGDQGPRIGGDGSPRCRRALGHTNPKHSANPEDGWGQHMTW
jgi:hypothetical protein